MRLFAGLAFLLVTLSFTVALAYEADEKQCRAVRDGKPVLDPLWLTTTDVSFQEAVKRDCGLVERQAVERGDPVTTIFAERKEARDVLIQKMIEREREEERLELFIYFSVGSAVIGAALLFRKMLVSAISRAWWQQSEEARVWAFISLAWVIGAASYCLFFNYDYMINDNNPLRVWVTVFFPPLFGGGLWFGYRRLVIKK